METTTKVSKLKYFSITKLFAGVITLLLVTLAFVPQAMVFIPDEFPEDQWWRPSYIWDDPIFLIIYGLFAVLWIAFLFVKQQKISKAIIVSLFVVSFCWSALLLGAVTFLAQDFIPSFGIYISFLMLPCLIIYLVSIRISNRSK